MVWAGGFQRIVRGLVPFGLASGLAFGLALVALPALADFETDLKRVEAALKKNPSQASGFAVRSCLNRYKFAVKLYEDGHEERASRRLRTCFELLDIPEVTVKARVSAPTQEDLEARARQEIERALVAEPDVARGLALYRECAGCHLPEGWGLSNGSVPQIAGQHRTVIIKQLADIRAGNRDAVLMVPYAAPEALGGAQGIADVAGYIDTLEISIDTNKGGGDDLAHGEALYTKHCARCHGAQGEGNAETFVPRVHSQHYNYLVRQFDWIKTGRRRNANAEMVAQIQAFSERDVKAVLDWVSRLEPPPSLQAPEGWKNPDFTDRPFE